MKTMFLIITLLTVFISAAPAKELTVVIVPDLNVEATASDLIQNGDQTLSSSAVVNYNEPTLVFGSGSVKPLAIIYSEYYEALVDAESNVWEPEESSYLISSNPLKQCLKDQIGSAFSVEAQIPSLLSDIILSENCD